MTRYGSLCSGIEAATVAWDGMGWEPAWFSQFDPQRPEGDFPSRILAHHYPEVPNLGDITSENWLTRASSYGDIDVLVGGTPCQAFSIAGLRKGLEDRRGQLSLRFVEIADAADPPVILWENVPGVLSDRTNGFGCLLAGLAGEDVPLQPAGRTWSNAGCVFGPKRTVAWRVLDAQYFGLAQRRRRVFVVASPGASGIDPCEILFEFEGVRRDSPPSREAGESTSHPIAPCPDRSGTGFSRTGDIRGQDPVVVCITGDRTHALSAEGADAGEDGTGRGTPIIAVGGNNTSGPITVAAALNANRGCPNPGDFEAGTLLVAFDTTQITSKTNRCQPKHGDPCHPLAAAAHPPAIAIQERAICENPDAGPDGIGVRTDDCAYILEARGVSQAVCFHPTQDPIPNSDNICHALGCGNGQGHAAAAAVNIGVRVRRLTPRECERLQGFPDDYTDIPKKVFRGTPKDSGPCKKQIVVATVVSLNGTHYVGTNHTMNPQTTCPRAGMPTGVGYELCRSICQQTAHAEVNALQLAGRKARGAILYIEGHTYACEPCLKVAKAAEISSIVFGKPPGTSADGPRYKALGNSMAVPVMRWLGWRIDSALRTRLGGYPVYGEIR
jgi:DNA (cytosine-5)-methyltransferase 1